MWAKIKNKRNKKKRVCVLGGGNWGTVIGKIVSENVLKMPDFEDIVKMYVMDEVFLGRQVQVIINQDHENPKYLPGVKLPHNLVADRRILHTVKNADILIFVLPRPLIKSMITYIRNVVKPEAVGLSLIKCVMKNESAEGGGVELISEVISKELGIPCWVMMGATIAREVAQEKYSEAVIGCKDETMGEVLRELLQTDYLRIYVTGDHKTVELCGALKHIMAFASGFCNALMFGRNTTATIIRVCFHEMIKFVQTFYPECDSSTFFLPCGISDFSLTLFDSRNGRIAEALVRTGKSIPELEMNVLKGHRVEGHFVAEQVYKTVLRANKVDEFPLFTSVHLICSHEIMPTEMLDRCVPNYSAIASGPYSDTFLSGKRTHRVTV